MQTQPITIYHALSLLEKMRIESVLGGETVLVLCLTRSELETVEVNDLSLVQDVNRPNDGATVEVRVSHPALDLDYPG